MRNFIFFVEGIHDINCIARILLINGFKEVSNINDIPEIWRSRVPRTYPFVDNRLDRFIPIPVNENIESLQQRYERIDNRLRKIEEKIQNGTITR